MNASSGPSPPQEALLGGLGRAGARGKLPKLAQFISAVRMQCAGRTCHPLSRSIIDNFHRQSKGLGSILHPLPQGLHTPCCTCLGMVRISAVILHKVKSTVLVGIHSQMRATKSRVFASKTLTSGS